MKLTLALLLVFCSVGVAEDTASFNAQVVDDFRLQAVMRLADSKGAKGLPQEDAAGGCDGVINGRWGFHTGEEKQPWWQVDLGESRPLGLVRLWNRCDAADRCKGFRLDLSADGKDWKNAYTHDDRIFLGFTDQKPLEIPMNSVQARFVRIQLPGPGYLHLDEVEVFGEGADAKKNWALGASANQSSASQWSQRAYARLAPEAQLSKEQIEQCWAQRNHVLQEPLLDFDTLLFVKRVPGSFNHMSDQNIGWWSRPGGGIYLLRNFKSGTPSLQCISEAFDAPGNFLDPEVSYDGTKVLVAWCRYYPGLAENPNKLDKSALPEDSFYHLYELDIPVDPASKEIPKPRRITQGKYNNFEGRYLPDGKIVFLSTRRTQAVQVGMQSAALSMSNPELPEVYVRCGGGPERPCAVYTLHTIQPDGTGLCAISPFEMFEWTPSVANDGSILYSRWDYIDRWNMPYMSLWNINPDGTNARIVYKNFTESPHCTFEPRSIPGSNKIIFTASGHHAQTMGSLVLLDPSVNSEGTSPITRLTPEVCFPEIEGWSASYYANPWPLSEDLYLVSWGPESTPSQSSSRAPNGMGIYAFRKDGVKALLYKDPDISCMNPIPVRPRTKPPVIASPVKWDGPQEGTFLLTDVYRGLKKAAPGSIKSLRLVAVPPKTHPMMNFPSMGVVGDDPGKCVIGTVPVEADGSAYFRAPSGVIMFFQALDENGIAIQTMRSATYVQPGQQASCSGCHEQRHSAPEPRLSLAASRGPSKITPGPEGSWPLRFDTLIQPVLDTKCVSCHQPGGKAEKRDLRPEKAYESLVTFGPGSLREHVNARYRAGRSEEGAGAAQSSPLLALLDTPAGHHGVHLSKSERERFQTWLDTYGQRQGSYSHEQEDELRELRRQWAPLLAERASEAALAAAHE